MKIPTFKKKTPALSYMHWIWKNKFMLHVYFFPVNKKGFWWVKMILQTMRIMLTDLFNLLVTNKVTTQW